MATTYTRTDIAAQAAILAAFSRAAGIMRDGDRLNITKSIGYALHIVRAGQSNLSAYPSAGSWGSIGKTAREAFHTLNTMQEQTRAVLDALNMPYTYPAAEIAAIRGEA